MEIRIQVIHKSEYAIVEQTYIIPIGTYDNYSYPDDVIHAEIERMRKIVKKEIPAAEQRGKDFKDKILNTTQS